MTYRAMYAYAWDVEERGVADFVADIRELGLDTVTLAGSYHAGKFLRPKGRNGKVYFPEDGTVYFRPDPARYGAIKPVLNSLVAEHDVLRALTDAGDIAVNAWMVLLHNSRLGHAHPDITVRNAFGDRYVYCLCPSAPAARDYAVALCGDVSENYPVLGLSLETPGFLPYVHGYHHEFALVKSNRWLENCLGLCFCEHCASGARRAGIDAGGLQARIRRDVEAYLATDLDLPDDMAEAFWLADIRDAELAAFLRYRCNVVTSLVAEIRAAVRPDAAVAVIPSVARPTAGAWYEGTDIGAIASAGAIIEACFYEPSAERVSCDLWDVQRRLAGHGTLRGILRPAHPDLKTRGDVIAAAIALRDAGVANIAFYNYGHLRQASLGWIAEAIAAFDA
jgi:hypothetical protein